MNHNHILVPRVVGVDPDPKEDNYYAVIDRYGNFNKYWYSSEVGWKNVIPQAWYEEIPNSLEEIRGEAWNACLESRYPAINPNFGSPFVEYDINYTFEEWNNKQKDKWER